MSTKSKVWPKRIVISIFSILFCLPVIFSGLKYSFGYGFWNAHGHDAIWHLALSPQTLKSFPPKNPVFAGHNLSGYHWGYNFFLELAHLVTTISRLHLHFRVLPIIFCLLIVLFSLKLKRNKTEAFLFLFLNFFAGSFGYVVTLLKDGQIGGESLFWSMQSISTLINPPYALSLVFFLAGLYWFTKTNSKQTSIYTYIILGILFGLTTIIKIYAAIIFGLGLSTYLLINYLRRKPVKKTLILTLSMGLTSVILLLLVGVSSSSLQFKPFWFIHSLIDAHDKLYIPKISALRFNLSSQLLSFKLPILLVIELLSFSIFLVGNLGTRIFAFIVIYNKFKYKTIKNFDILLFSIAFFALLFPLLFIQAGTAWNTIQFFYYFQIILNFYFATYLYQLLKDKRFLFFSILILLTIPTTISSLKSFIGFPPPSTLPTSEIKALEFLQKQPNGIVLTYPYDPDSSKPDTPVPLYLYETTSYVSAFSQKITFLEDQMNLEITGFPWQERLKLTQAFFNSSDPHQASGFLINNLIDYIYLVGNQKLPSSLANHQIRNIYQSDNVSIYKVLK